MRTRKFVVLFIIFVFFSGCVTVDAYNKQEVRIWGQTRFETSYRIAEEIRQESGKLNIVIVAYGDAFPDALSGSYLSIVRDAPIVLVNQKYEKKTLNEIKKISNKNALVYMLGGTNVVSKDFEEELKKEKFEVKRLGGKNRYDTNLLILEEADKYAKRPEKIVITTGNNYADALSASASGYPILLVDKKLAHKQIEYINKTTPVSGLYICGGTGAVSESLERQLNSFASPTRIGGWDRYDTSYVYNSNNYMLNKKPDSILITYGNNFPDGLCGALLAHRNNAPLLLASDDRWQEAHNYAYRNKINKVIILGGTGVIKDDTAKKVINRKLKVVAPKSTQINQDNIYPKWFKGKEKSNTKLGTAGNLYIPKLKHSVPLELYTEEGSVMQTIVDKKETACVWDNSRDGRTSIHVFDHADQGLYGLWTIKYGDKVQIKTEDKVRTFVCVGAFSTDVVNYKIMTTFGLNLYGANYYDLSLYTCQDRTATKDVVRTFIEV